MHKLCDCTRPAQASIDDDLGGGIGHRAVASSAPAARHVTFGIHGDERRTSSFEPVAHVPHERRPTPSIGFNAARAVSAPLAVASVTGVDSSWGSPLPHSREAEAQPLHGGATGGSWLMTFGYPQQYEAAVVAFIEEAAGDAAVEARRSGRRLLLCFATRESMEHGLLADESESAVPGAIISVVPATSVRASFDVDSRRYVSGNCALANTLSRWWCAPLPLLAARGERR